MAIPGLYAFVQETIKDQVSAMYLWPKTLEISIIDAPSVKQPVGMLHVTVVRAANLNKKDLLGKSDPYVKLTLGEGTLGRRKTTTKMSNLNPEWNESFNLPVQDPETQVLEIHVYDWEKVGSHDRLGMQVVPLKDLIPGETKTLTLKLLKNIDANDPVNLKSRGTLTLEATFKPFKEELVGADENEALERAPDGTPPEGGLLVVTIHEAEDLEGKHHTNPFVKLVFRGEKRKTKPVKKNRDPRWGEYFEFVLNEPPINDRLHLEVISKNMGFGVYFREPLGYVDISLSDVVNNKRINEKYQLIDSKNGKLLVELQWKPS
ncbi:hypothetical protein O6H91_Y052800 [Diphasiastrum complanatum]|nr:hypothetical protein O6H91_Y052800 [Diphasiastrum complanatum]